MADVAPPPQTEVWTSEFLDFCMITTFEDVCRLYRGGAQNPRAGAEHRRIQHARRLVHCHGPDRALAILNGVADD